MVRFYLWSGEVCIYVGDADYFECDGVFAAKFENHVKRKVKRKVKERTGSGRFWPYSTAHSFLHLAGAPWLKLRVYVSRCPLGSAKKPTFLQFG